jgi:hypothetical protein
MQGTAVVQFKFFRLFKSFTNRHLEGRKASPRFRQRASSPERPCVLRCQKQKVPRPYSVAEEGAPSLTGSRDDDLCDKDGHDSSKAIQTASLPRHASTQAVRQQISRLLPIIDFSKTQPAGLRLLFRPYLVIAQLSHEYFLVYGLPGVVEHRRDASRAANFRALPWNDDQRRGRFLIAQNGHA